jgi:hypothetical protein
LQQIQAGCGPQNVVETIGCLLGAMCQGKPYREMNERLASFGWDKPLVAGERSPAAAAAFTEALYDCASENAADI